MAISSKRLIYFLIITLLAMGVAFGAPADTGSKKNDSLQYSIDQLESNVRSTLMFGGSSPVSFSGEGRMKLQHHAFSYEPDFMRQDQSWPQANWEGNESMIRIGMVVNPSRNTVLWSKIGFQNTLPGIDNAMPSSSDGSNGGFVQEQVRHDKSDITANIHEDMCAGIAIRTVPASFWFKMGNVLWTEASPLTIWKSQPRNVAWDFLPFEVEQPVQRYYEYNIVKGEKDGRASWHKKAFNGINLESINLPWDLYFNAVYAAFERYDNFEREYVDWSNDLAYAGLTTLAKGQGIGDSYRHMLHLRLAKENAFAGLTAGLNYVGIDYHKDFYNDTLVWTVFGFPPGVSPYNAPFNKNNYSLFYKEPKIASFDLKGTLNNVIELQTDIAVSIVDTTHVLFDTLGAQTSSWTWNEKLSSGNINQFKPAGYVHIKGLTSVPLTADLAYISRGFYSPFSFAMPVDAFYAFGSNLLGAGKFLERSEASPYTQNMAGINLTAAPNIGYGHFRINYGQHFQPDVARDLLFFPYRLNGSDLFSVFQSSYNRWGNDEVDVSLSSKYNKRLGDESLLTNAYGHPLGPDAGGLRSDYLAMFEGFVPYDNAAQADSNLKSQKTIDYTNIGSQSPFVPQHRKFTFNLETDIAYDIGKMIGYSNDFFLSGYGAINGVETKFTPLAIDQKNQMLWSAYGRFEPAIAINPKLYILGLAGIENWRADKAYSVVTTQNGDSVVLSPINYVDLAYGIGTDWEMAPRVGLHLRAKWMEHHDKALPTNDWATPILSAEIKMWF